ncbi:unnamed protein product, partial [marine sediment metagenome]
MKIKTKLLLSAGASIVLAVVLGAIVLATHRQVDQAMANGETAVQVFEAVAELDHLSSDYVLHGEDRARIQWYSRHESLVDLTVAEESGESIGQNLEALEATFAQLVANRERQAANEAEMATVEALEERLVAQLSLQSQSLTADATQLADASRAEISSAHQRATVSILALVGVLLAIVAGTSVAVFLSIGNPITKLTSAAE